jgi:predicted aldo/keto reductase-like oxidoreductase
LGGEGVLRTFGQEEAAVPLIRRALDLGVTYFETARAYSGSESYYGAALGARRKEIFLASKSHERSQAGALDQLQTTLKNLKTPYLDLWMVHDVRTSKDLDRIFGSKGAIHTFDTARKNGTVRFIGISGHQDPAILSKALDLFSFDVVLMPVNPAEPAHKSFLEEALPKARNKGLGILAMKTLLRGAAPRAFGPGSVSPFLRYALSHPVSAVVVGCDDVSQLDANLRIVRAFEPMEDQDQQWLLQQVKPYARELMYYKP